MWLERRVPDASPYQIRHLVCAGPGRLATLDNSGQQEVTGARSFRPQGKRRKGRTKSLEESGASSPQYGQHDVVGREYAAGSQPPSAAESPEASAAKTSQTRPPA